MYGKEDIVDLHKRPTLRLGMTTVIFVIYLVRRVEYDIVDRVETESQDLLLDISEESYVEYNKVYAETYDIVPSEVEQDLRLTSASSGIPVDRTRLSNKQSMPILLTGKQSRQPISGPTRPSS